MTARVGLVGLGRMGRAIAARLAEEGVDLHVWNRTPGKAEGLAVREAGTPAALAQATDIILVIVRDEAALEAIYKGPHGLCSVDLSGKTIVEMSTAAIQAIRDVLASANEAGAQVVDAPVSGSVQPARRGELLVMAGGEEAAVERASVVLTRIARRIVHVGPLGTGITMKLVVNLPLATYWQTLGEALGIGLRNGLTLDGMLAMIADSKAAIGALAGKIDRILDADLPPEFDLAGMAKDLTAMCCTARALDHPVPACDAARSSAVAAVDAGWGERDLAQLTRFAADRAAPSE
ncbi:3-hydroxyisobutyrate dehydrogenase [Novosphingobium endophyticum]|uniref:3-hydroxyisobutyrate dehydrogenase n=1 Tax=Novosphingobium endophyticum TaxID=1955250 RepID=A0A916TUY6_9SPHN|nr:NAD(P)-dependent oxidoreductase [Novosphingobium endophyticum]GGC12959.1 3-hydroxyisobutyrate dehydrogenase [Novosphingobium endophyticum]